MKFAQNQPKDRETVLHCGHLEGKPHHFFALPEEAVFTRPDKTTGNSRWIVLCNSCFLAHADAPAACIRADAEWIGDEPEIKENFN